MERNTYALTNTTDLISPALIYYKDIILENTKRIIDMAGGTERLWPHVKSHKASSLIRMQTELGIRRFKCATIAEAEMTAEAGGTHIILAYPLIGPNISRYLHLAKAFPKTVFYAIGDDFVVLSVLAAEASKMDMIMNVLIDVDIGMHRTGVPIDLLQSFYERTSSLKGITVKGLHCYDGHCNNRDINIRKAMAEENDKKVLAIQQILRQKGFECETLVMGGTPSFPCRTGKADFYLSPGTLFINDWGYYSNLPDLPFTPGAAILSRVISHSGTVSEGGGQASKPSPGTPEAENRFTLDLGHKGIAADPAGARGVIAGLPEAKPLSQSEEHWVFSIPSSSNRPPIGSDCYVIPTHICPTSALYPEIMVAQRGKIIESWQVSARNRRITY